MDVSHLQIYGHLYSADDELSNEGSGKGVPDMLLWLVQWMQKTQWLISLRVVTKYSVRFFEIKVNGMLHEGDQTIV